MGKGGIGEKRGGKGERREKEGRGSPH